MLEERPEGTYYTGPLNAGIAVAHRERYSAEGLTRPGVYRVNLSDSPAIDALDERDLAEWGSGPDRETAWRYALGALFGPIDDEYDADHLRRLIDGAVQS